VGEITRI